MGYGVEILPLEKLIEHAEALKEISIERCIASPKDEGLQIYRDYNFSVAHYLQELKKSKQHS